MHSAACGSLFASASVLLRSGDPDRNRKSCCAAAPAEVDCFLKNWSRAVVVVVVVVVVANVAERDFLRVEEVQTHSLSDGVIVYTKEAVV